VNPLLPPKTAGADRNHGAPGIDGVTFEGAFTENAAAQAAPLATNLGVPVAGFDAYLAEWRTLQRRSEALLDRWVRFALSPLSGGAAPPSSPRCR
jgi:hypothetical protein